MCGDVDEDEGALEELLYGRFLAHARALLQPQGGRETAAKAAPEDLDAYADKLFSDALSRCVRDGEEVTEAARQARREAQPLVLARLAGLLAGHLGLERDPLRKVIEALMAGYAEAQAVASGHDHDHDHDQGHDHDHHGHHH